MVDRIELSGAAVPDLNGAGIRQEGTDLTVTRSWFHDNENGILTGADADSDVVITRSGSPATAPATATRTTSTSVPSAR